MNVLYCTLVLKQTNSLHWYVQLFRIQIGMSCMVQPGEGFSHIDLVYVYVPFQVLFCKIWYSDRWVFIRDEGAQIPKLGVFWANYCKKHPIWSKLGAFLSEKVHWWEDNGRVQPSIKISGWNSCKEQVHQHTIMHIIHVCLFV